MKDDTFGRHRLAADGDLAVTLDHGGRHARRGVKHHGLSLAEQSQREGFDVPIGEVHIEDGGMHLVVRQVGQAVLDGGEGDVPLDVEKGGSALPVSSR